MNYKDIPIKIRVWHGGKEFSHEEDGYGDPDILKVGVQIPLDKKYYSRDGKLIQVYAKIRDVELIEVDGKAASMLIDVNELEGKNDQD